MKILAALALAAVCGSAFPPPLAAQPSPAVGVLAKAFLAESTQRDPLFASSLGIHTYDDRFADYSAAGHAARIAWLREWRERIASAGARAVSLDDRADARELLHTIDLELFEDGTLRPWRTDPGIYVNSIGSALYILASRTFAPQPVRFANVAKRLALLPGVAAAAEANLTASTRVAALQAIDANAGNIELVRSLPSTPAIDRNRPIALAALRKLQAFLRGPFLARSQASPRVGTAIYDRELQLAEGTDLTRAQLVARARADFDATRARMLVLALPLDRKFFPAKIVDESKPDAVDVVVRRVLDRLANDHPGRDGIFALAKADVAAANAFLTADPVVVLPTPPTLHVVPTPAFLAGFAGASFDPSGPFTPLAESFYYIDQIPKSWTARQITSYLRDHNTYEMRILSIHEAVPGHYVQFRYNNATPSLVRRVYGNGSYIEGWAVYCEGMMLDAGYGANDSRLRLFQLKWRLREQANTLIDAGYHTTGMTKAQLDDLLVRQAYQERSQVETKWHRLELSHNQLSSYYVGLSAIMRARDDLKATLGPRFSVAAFNLALLQIGSVEPRDIEPLVAAKLGIAL
jgi:hypothetical protein